MEIRLEKLKVFSGDGKLYDAIRQPGDPVRIGSILYEEVLVMPLEDEPVLTDTIAHE